MKTVLRPLGAPVMTLIVDCDAQLPRLSQHFNETYLLFPLPARFLCCDQGFAVGAALRCEVDFGQSVFHQRHGQIDAVDVQPADEVPRLVHALHFHFHLEQRNTGEGRGRTS